MAATDTDHYAGLTWWGPYGEDEIEALLASIQLPPGARVLDVGCGHGALLLRMAERYGAEITGVDRSTGALDRARLDAAARGLEERATWLEQASEDLAFEGASFDAIAWLGGPPVGSTHTSTIASLTHWLRPGGWLILGQGFWTRPPPEEYLAATGLAADALSDEATMLGPVRAAGLECLLRVESSRAAWDHFEHTLLANHERSAAAHPDDEAVQAHIARQRAWQEAQQRWGRDVMGFALYLLRAPTE